MHLNAQKLIELAVSNLLQTLSALSLKKLSIFWNSFRMVLRVQIVWKEETLFKRVIGFGMSLSSSGCVLNTTQLADSFGILKSPRSPPGSKRHSQSRMCNGPFSIVLSLKNYFDEFDPTIVCHCRIARLPSGSRQRL